MSQTQTDYATFWPAPCTIGRVPRPLGSPGRHTGALALRERGKQVACAHARLRNVFQLAPPRRLGGQRHGGERDTPCESLQPFCCQSGPLEKENGCVLVYCDCFLVVLNAQLRSDIFRGLERARCYCQPLHLASGGGTPQPSGTRPGTGSKCVGSKNMSPPAPIVTKIGGDRETGCICKDQPVFVLLFIILEVILDSLGPPSLGWAGSGRHQRPTAGRRAEHPDGLFHEGKCSGTSKKLEFGPKTLFFAPEPRLSAPKIHPNPPDPSRKTNLTVGPAAERSRVAPTASPTPGDV